MKQEINIDDYCYYWNKDYNELYIHKIISMNDTSYRTYSFEFKQERMVSTDNVLVKITNSRLLRLIL